MTGLINGVHPDAYGTWCRHGHHVLVVDPDDQGDHPGTIPAEPWPCGQGCTPESLEAEMWADFDD